MSERKAVACEFLPLFIFKSKCIPSVIYFIVVLLFFVCSTVFSLSRHYVSNGV